MTLSPPCFTVSMVFFISVVFQSHTFNFGPIGHWGLLRTLADIVANIPFSRLQTGFHPTHHLSKKPGFVSCPGCACPVNSFSYLSCGSLREPLPSSINSRIAESLQLANRTGCCSKIALISAFKSHYICTELFKFQPTV